MQEALNQLEQVLRRLAAEPLAAPLAAGLGALLVAIFLLHTVAKGKKERTGTVYEGGVRRSTRQAELFWASTTGRRRLRRRLSSPVAHCVPCRQHKAPESYHPESPAPAKTPRAAVSKRSSGGGVSSSLRAARWPPAVPWV